MLRHTNYYYPCKYCFKKFRNISNLVSHSKKVHRDMYQSDDELDFVPITNDELLSEAIDEEEQMEVVLVTNQTDGFYTSYKID